MAAAAADYTEEDALHRQALEQKLRHRPNDRGVLVALADILASKSETKEALELLHRASVGIASDPDAAVLLRKIAKAKLSLWQGLRLHHGSELFVNCSEERRKHALEAVDFFEQACTYPENNGNPAAMIEGGNAKVAASDLVGALKDFSAVVSNFPAYPGLSVAICRAACLLVHLGDFAQAAQYFAYVLEDPPLDLGFGEFEVRGLLTSCLHETGGTNGEAGVRLYTVLAGALNRSPPPPGFSTTPPEGVAFRSWGAPWKLLADRMLARSDYVAAAEFLRMYLKREKTPEAYVLLGEVWYMLGDKERAIENMAKAHKMDSECAQGNKRLLEWDFETWAPTLDKAAAAALVRKRKADALAARMARADAHGIVLRGHMRLNHFRATLNTWYVFYAKSFAATSIGRIARGNRARALAVKLRKEARQLAANTKRVVGKIHAHLLRHIVVSWRRVYREAKAYRRGVATPLRVRVEHRLLVLVVAGWKARARRQVIGRETARLAMRGPADWGTKESGVKDPSTLFYSEPLANLARFPLVRKKHDEALVTIMDEKLRAKELLDEIEVLPAIGSDAGSRDESLPSTAKKKKRKKKKAGAPPASPSSPTS